MYLQCSTLRIRISYLDRLFWSRDPPITKKEYLPLILRHLLWLRGSINAINGPMFKAKMRIVRLLHIFLQVQHECFCLICVLSLLIRFRFELSTLIYAITLFSVIVFQTFWSLCSTIQKVTLEEFFWNLDRILPC